MRQPMIRTIFCVLASGAVLAGYASAGSRSVDPSSQPIFVPPFGPTSPAPGGGNGTITPGDGSRTVASPVFGITQEATGPSTESILAAIDLAVDFCSGLSGSGYLIDCIGYSLWEISNAIPETGDYAEAREALQTAGLAIEALARRNADPTRPRGVARTPGPEGITTTRPLTPVSPAAESALAETVIDIIEEAETVLLRSAESSAQRRVHYQRIAAAIGSNKVLLRSG